MPKDRITKANNRLLYIEPNDIASSYSGVTLSDNMIGDNIIWNNEDLKMLMNLTAIVPSRMDCGLNDSYHITIDNENDFVGFLKGSTVQIGDGTENILTTDYVNISYNEIKSGEKSTSEFLGISSININFDKQFFPTVDITFVDVRGYSIMSPAEDSYLKGVDGRNNFFKTLFSLPTPRFLLTVKGYFGTSVTFMLAVEGFKSDFNASTGDFGINVKFKGYMYGVYCDIPFTALLVSPYIGGTNTSTIDNTEDNRYFSFTSEYWRYQRDNNVFVYDNGTPMYTFLEYLKRYIGVMKEMSKDAIVEGNENIKYIKNVDDAKKLIGEISSDYEIIKSEILKTDNDTLTEDKEFPDNYVINCEGRIDDDILSININSLNIDIASMNSLLNDLNIVNKKLLELNYVSDEKEIRETFTDPNTAGFGILERIISYTYKWIGAKKFEEVLNEIKSIVVGYEVSADVKEKAVSEYNDNIEKLLGFSPNIQNYYRMLFAHIDCFMTQYYNVLTNIKSGNRTLSDFANLGIDKDYIDISEGSSLDTFVPPYPAMYKRGERGDETSYPLDCVDDKARLRSLMPEVNFVDEIVNATLSVTKEMNDIRNIMMVNDSVPSGDFAQSFIPTNFDDIYYYGENPYAVAVDKFKRENDVSAVLYTFVLRALNRNLTCPFHESRESFIANEAINLLLVIGNAVNEKTWGVLEGLNGNKTEIIKLLDKYSGGTLQTANRLVKDGDYFSYIKISHSVEELEKGNNNAKRNLTLYSDDLFQPTTTEGNLHWVRPIYFGDENYNEIYKQNKDDAQSMINIFDLDTAERFNNEKLFEEYPHVRFVKAILDDEYIKNPEYIPYVEFKTLDGKKHNYFGQIGANYKKGLSQTAMAQFFLACLPFDFDAVGKIIKEIKGEANDNEYATRNVSDIWNIRSRIKAYPKIIILYIGALIHRYITFKEQGVDELCYFIYNGNRVRDISKVKGIENITGLYENHVSYSFRQLNGSLVLNDNIENIKNQALYERGYYVSDVRNNADISIADFVNNTNYYVIRKIEDYFLKWVEGEYNELSNLLSSREGYKDGTLIVSSAAHSKLIDFYNEKIALFIINNNADLRSIKVSIDDITDFVEETLYKSVGHVITDETKTNDDNEIENSDISNDIRFNIYYTFKKLYDKWLCLCSVDRFKLKTFDEDYNNRLRRFVNNEYIDNINEYSNFLFVDGFYNDISRELLLSPEIVNSIIMDFANGTFNANTYEIMHEIAAKHGLLFQSLPIYNNVYSSNELINVFTPNVKNDYSNRIGNTYICMYTSSPSRVVSVNSGHYRDDGLMLNVPDKINGEYFPLTDDSTKLNIMVPSFGVTYAKQSQGYFKNIKVQMDNPKTTNYSIVNLFSLMQGSARGDVLFPYAVGQDIFSVYSNRSYNCSVEMMGCMNIMPMMYFQLNNIPMFNGSYMITNVSHSLRSGQMVTNFTGVRMSRNIIPFNKDVFNLQRLIKSLALSEINLNDNNEQ